MRVQGLGRSGEAVLAWVPVGNWVGAQLVTRDLLTVPSGARGIGGQGADLGGQVRRERAGHPQWWELGSRGGSEQSAAGERAEQPGHRVRRDWALRIRPLIPNLSPLFSFCLTGFMEGLSQTGSPRLLEYTAALTTRNCCEDPRRQCR